jgi:hypothetical protein
MGYIYDLNLNNIKFPYIVWEKIDIFDIDINIRPIITNVVCYKINLKKIFKINVKKYKNFYNGYEQYLNIILHLRKT